MAGKLTDSKVARLCQVLIEDINSLTYSELQVFRETDEAKRLLKILLSRPTTVSIDWSKAPVDADRAIEIAGCVRFLKMAFGSIFIDTVDGWVNVEPKIDGLWLKATERPPVSNGDFTPEQVTRATTEHFMCCGTTCDREAAKRYIERLEVVADAAHHLEQSGVLAGTPRMQNLKTALEELQSE